MSINSSREFLADVVASGDYLITEHILAGRNIQLAPGLYPPPDWNLYPTPAHSVTFTGTTGKDTLFAGGGELLAFFMGSRGDDLYGVGPSPDVFVNSYVDYSEAKKGVFLDGSYRGSRTFIDAEGETQTVAVIGRARDGFGGTDYFAESAEDWAAGSTSVIGVFGSSHRDVMIDGGAGFFEFYGGAGDDLLIGWSCYGGAGDDRLIRTGAGDWSGWANGEEGDDCLIGSDFIDSRLSGGAGDDCIFAKSGNDGYVTGNEGNDYVDGGAGDDFIDGGVGKDVLVSGAGSDIINPDVEYFQLDPNQARDGARDVIRVTRADVGDFNDVVLSRAFEEDRDQVRFCEAAAGRDFRVYHEDQSINPATGRPFRSDDLADRANTVLQIDVDGDGFGGAAADGDDYFLFVLDADLAQRSGWLLT